MAPVKKENSTPKAVPKSSKVIAKVKMENDGNQQDIRKEFTCSECNKVFYHIDTFKNHLAIHEEKFKCRHCGKACPTDYNLKRHEASHTGERGFQCGTCQRGFVQRSDLVGHNCSTPARRTFTITDDAIVVASGQVKFEAEEIKKLEEDKRKLREELEEKNKLSEKLEEDNRKLREELEDKNKLCKELSEKLEKFQHEAKAAKTQKVAIKVNSRQAAEDRATELVPPKENEIEEGDSVLSEPPLDRMTDTGLPELSDDESENVEPFEDHSHARKEQKELIRIRDKEASNSRIFVEINDEDTNGAEPSALNAPPAAEKESAFITVGDLGLPRRRCVFCWGEHLADRCSKFTSAADKNTLQKRFLLCASCLTLHPKQTCPPDLVQPCTYCDEKGHHPSLLENIRFFLSFTADFNGFLGILHCYFLLNAPRFLSDCNRLPSAYANNID